MNRAIATFILAVLLLAISTQSFAVEFSEPMKIVGFWCIVMFFRDLSTNK